MRATPTRARCTASGRERSWPEEAWSAGEGSCPDCGARVKVWVRGFDRFPRAKARAHYAPAGSNPAPYAAQEAGAA